MTALGENQAALNNSSRHSRQYFVEEVWSGESRPHDNLTFDQKSKKNRNIKMPCVYLKKIVLLFFLNYWKSATGFCLIDHDLCREPIKTKTTVNRVKFFLAGGLVD